VKCLTKLIIFFSVITSTSISFGAQTNYFVTPGGSGSRDGKTISSAWSVNDFNNSNNWTDSDDNDIIDPGDTVYFSGSFKSIIYLKGSGKAGKTITIDGADATLGYDGDWGRGLIRIDGKNYLTIKNFQIDCGYKTGPSETHNGIYIKGTNDNPSTNITIDNNEITQTVTGIYYGGNVQNLTITRNRFHDLNGSGVRGGKYTYDEWAWPPPKNITIGGAPGMGNSFVDVGYLDSYYNTDAFAHLDHTSDIIFSYNIGYSTKKLWGMTGLYGNNIKNVLIEYNILHSFNSDHHRPPIAMKGDLNPCEVHGPYIIRFNHIWNSHGDDKSWGDSSPAFTCSGNWAGLYAYGNNIHDCSSAFGPTLGYSSNKDGCPDSGTAKYLWRDGKDVKDIYIFSNIISKTQGTAVYTGGYAGNNDSINNVYVFNNTFYKVGTRQTDLGFGYSGTNLFTSSSGIGMTLKGYQYNTHVYRNNLIIDPRPNDTYKLAMKLRSTADNFENNFNHAYDSSFKTLFIEYRDDSDNATKVNWGASSNISADGEYNSIGNPHLKNLNGMDFRLTENSKALIGTGEKMGTGNIITLVIQGQSYPIPWDFSLGPNTIFSATNPDKIIIDAVNQNELGWNRGAYSLVESQGSLAKVRGVKVGLAP